MDKVIKIEVADHIAVLTISRAQALNAINKDVMWELNDFFDGGYQSYGRLYGIIITGEGEKAFVAGADIKGFSSLDSSSASAMSKYGQDTFFLIERFHLPVIAAVNGFALGGGCELAMACHMRIAVDGARFGQPEVNLGLIPGYGGTQRLPQLVGKSKAIELTLTGDMIDANEALRLGLVNHVTDIQALLPMCRSIIQKIGSKGPLAVAHAIKAINAFYQESEDGYIVEYDTFGKLMVDDECKEGVAAFLEKRKPSFH